MNTLMSIRTNLFYTKKSKINKEDKDEFIKQHELIFLVDKPKYSRTNAGEIVRERDIEELRFCVSNEQFDKVIELLKTLKDCNEDDLV